MASDSTVLRPMNFARFWLPLLVLIGLAPFGTSHAAERRLVVVSTTTGYRHDSIPAGNRVIRELADRSDAFEIVAWIEQPSDGEGFGERLSEALSLLAPAKLDEMKIDGVVFNNTTGDLPLPDPQGFIDWIEAGHAFIGMHAASDTFPGFPPYLDMVGGCFDGHPWHEAVTLKVEDPDHPAAGNYTGTFEITDEIYQFKDWSRDDKNVILSLDPSNEDRPPSAQPDGSAGPGFFERGKRADRDYAVCWVKELGKGRVFYTALGHGDEVWMDPDFQKHLLGGIEWALGLPETGSD